MGGSEKTKSVTLCVCFELLTKNNATLRVLGFWHFLCKKKSWLLAFYGKGASNDIIFFN